jgi:hypothetical protein
MPNPLSSDVFLGWVRGDPDAKKLEEDVKAATRYLHTQVIPTFAKHLEERSDEILRLGPAKFVQFLHATGINCRHIGEVRSHTQNAAMRRLLATEMVSRVVKNDIALRLRSKMAELGLAFEAPYQQARLLRTSVRRVISGLTCDPCRRCTRTCRWPSRAFHTGPTR